MKCSLCGQCPIHNILGLERPKLAYVVSHGDYEDNIIIGVALNATKAKELAQKWSDEPIDIGREYIYAIDDGKFYIAVYEVTE